jgi:glycosyltransferase involved in cell wall biosynthesis
MKIVYVARLFSGLALSVQQQKWQPSGVPTIYKMIENLDAEQNVTVLLLPKGGFRQKKHTRIKLPPLHGDFHILPSEHIAPLWLGRRIGFALREIVQLITALKMIFRLNPDVLYVDHANVLIAALVARFNKNIRVVFRIMGCQGLKTSFNGNNVMLRLFRWGYRSPFAAAICTQDGSNADYWLNRALLAKVPRHVLLNGVDAAQTGELDGRIKALPKDKTIVLSIGRLDFDKAADEFLQAFLIAWRGDKRHLHALIIGTGALKAQLLAEIKRAGAEDAVTFIENLPHEQIALVHRHCDIYVSLNREGNLSNANLEAMQAGQCMIIPKSQPDTGIDSITDALLSDQAVYRVSRADNVQEIAAAITRLHTHPELRAAMSAQLAQETAKFLYSWEERIQREVAILEGLGGSAWQV